MCVCSSDILWKFDVKFALKLKGKKKRKEKDNPDYTIAALVN